MSSNNLDRRLEKQRGPKIIAQKNLNDAGWLRQNASFA